MQLKTCATKPQRLFPEQVEEENQEKLAKLGLPGNWLLKCK